MIKHLDNLKTPIGLLEISASDKGITSLTINKTAISPNIKSNPNLYTEKCKKQLAEYFSHDRESFDLDLDLSATDFQLKVWQALKSVEYGSTSSYSDIAKAIENKNAIRASGTACGKNPIAIIIPCHRIISKSGSIGNYAYGTEVKQLLLVHEKNHPRFRQ